MRRGWQGGVTRRMRQFSSDDAGHLIFAAGLSNIRFMLKRIIFGILILGLTCFAPACESEPETITQTLGAFLEDMSYAACERFAACGSIEENRVEDCVDIIVNELCTTGTPCSDEVTANRADFYACIDAFETFSCDGLDVGYTPSECFVIEEYI